MNCFTKHDQTVPEFQVLYFRVDWDLKVTILYQ